MSRDELVECAALLRAVRQGELDRIVPHDAPLDVLAQQIVAEASSADCREDDLFELVTRAWPYRDLERESFDGVVRMLADGFATRRGRRGALIHRDEVQRRVTGRAFGAADRDDLRRRHPGDRRLSRRARSGGAVHRHAQRGLRHREQRRRHLSARQQLLADSPGGGGRGACRRCARRTAVAPFWLGEAPARSAELSRRGERSSTPARRSIGRGRAGRLRAGPVAHGRRRPRYGSRRADRQLLRRVAARSWGPARRRTRSCWSGSSTNRAGCSSSCMRPSAAVSIARGRWHCESGSAASSTSSCRRPRRRTRCCCRSARSTRFRSPTCFATCTRTPSADVLIQAFLDAPVFQTRWRWNATVSLAVPRNRGGKKVPAPLQRMQADDLLAAAFPDAAACLENIPGDRQIPDHPLVNQTVRDCLEEAMDLAGAPHDPAADPRRRRFGASPATRPSPLRSRTRSSTRGRTSSSTTRRSRNVGRRP